MPLGALRTVLPYRRLEEKSEKDLTPGEVVQEVAGAQTVIKVDKVVKVYKVYADS
jgi:hypothetical protein